MERRRLYLMRHAEVTYFGGAGEPLSPDTVSLTAAGREQAEAARRAFADVAFDRVVTSGLPRTDETARIVAPAHEPEHRPEFEEWRGGRLVDIADEKVEQAYVGALRVEDESARFLGGESLGELLDRTLPAFDRLLEDDWDTLLAVFHGGVNRALLAHALTGRRAYFGAFEQAPACINVLDAGDDGSWVVRTVNWIPYDPLHPARSTTMEQYWEQYRPYRTGAG
jgi:broad specificity phosphatase PhoE